MPHWPATFSLHSAALCAAFSRKMINPGKHKAELLGSVIETEKNKQEGGEKKERRAVQV